MSLDEAGQLKQAIDRNDIERVKTMMTRNPALHRAPLGYGKDGPLGFFPIIFSPCESVDPEALKWLLDRGANPNCGNADGRGTALDYVIGTYERSPERLSACIDMLLDAGGTTKYDVPGVLALLRHRLDSLAEQLDTDSTLVHRRFPELDCGSTGARRMLLQGATLLQWPRSSAMLTRQGSCWIEEQTSMRAPRETRLASAGKLPFSTPSLNSAIAGSRWRNSWSSAAPTLDCA